MDNEQISTGDTLMRHLTAKWISKPVSIAAELRIPDILAKRPMSLSELSEVTDTNKDYLHRVLRVLVSTGIFLKDENGQYQNTSTGALLKTGIMRSICLMFNSNWNDEAWLMLSDCMKSGDYPFERAHMLKLNDWLSENPEAAEIFNEANSFRTSETGRLLTETYDFSSDRLIVDVGGGTGILLANILKSYPLSNGILADKAEVLKHSSAVFEKFKIDERLECRTCDVFESIPSGGDVYILSSILHDWNDDNCIKILGNCKSAMKAGSKLLIIELIIPEGDEFSISKLLDLEMLVITGGKERNENEFRNLISESGLSLEKIISMGKELYILECIVEQ